MPQVNFNAEEATSEPAIGTTDFEKTMIEVAEGKVPETKTEETSDRPEWLNEKFKTPEDMAKAYSELEKKLGKSSDKTEETSDKTSEENAEDKSEGDAEDKTDDKSEGSLDFDRYSTEVLESGELSAESYAELAKQGIPKAVVDAYVGQQVAQVEAVTNDFYSTVGGEENYGEVAKWAADNVDQAQLDSFNKALNDNDTAAAKSLLTGFYNGFKDATGFEGTTVTDSMSSAASTDEFQNWEQVQVAMKDPKYRSDKYRDPAYVAEVDAKIGRSRRLS